MSTSEKDKDPQKIYNEEYFQKYCGGIPYNRNEAHWSRFFGSVADMIVQIIEPRSVMDLGCAKGFLVEALRDKGVEAYGIDISRYAISQVRDDIKQFCRIGSVTEPLEKDYDLIICIEVLEHVSEEVAKVAIQNMVKRTHNILFTSSPNDFDEPTHINVHPVIYWLELFSEYGFYPDLTVDADFVAPWALLLRKKSLVQGKDLLQYFARSIDTKNALAEKNQQIAKLQAAVQAQQQTIRDQQQRMEVQQLTIESQQQVLNSIYARIGWKLLNKLGKITEHIFPRYTKRRKLYDLMIKQTRLILNDGWSAFLNRFKLKTIYRDLADENSYKLWILKNEPDKDQLKAMKLESQSWSYRPKISIIMPVYNSSKYDIMECIKSVLSQVYDNWELCIADGASDRAYVKKIIQKFVSKDPRIKVVTLPQNLGIAGNSNEALKLATGEYVGFLDHDDMLALFALYEVVKLLNQNPHIDFTYSDEDKVHANSEKRYIPFFKPDWSPDTFLSYNYLCHFAVARRKIVEEIGGLRLGFDGSQDYDLILRIIQKTTNIKRIPKILYHWRASQTSVASGANAKPKAYPAAKKALTEYLKNQGLEGEVLDGFALGAYRIKYRVESSPNVSIIIPTKDKVQLLERCVSSILTKTDHINFEIIIVDNQSREPETYDFFKNVKKNQNIKILPYDKPFNFSAINNYAVHFSDSEYIVFLNNDTEVISNEWLTAMLEFAQRKDVGAVGAKLYHPNSTVQHGGVIIGMGGIAAHAHRDFPRESQGYVGRLKIIHNVSAVTAACMMLRKKVFEEVGGFDEQLSHAFNDVDLCLKIREKGYLIVFTPYAELYHRESASRGYDLDTPEGTARFSKEVELMQGRWKHILEAGDPYYNPNLTLDKPDFSIKI